MDVEQLKKQLKQIKVVRTIEPDIFLITKAIKAKHSDSTINLKAQLIFKSRVGEKYLHEKRIAIAYLVKKLKN